MSEESSWFGFDDLFWLTLLVLFGSALLGALLRRLRKDRCLRLFDDFHVTLINSSGTPEWGDLLVTGNGVELTFDEPYTNRHGLVKASHLVREAELLDSLGMIRTVHALTDIERERRSSQIERTFDPGLLRRGLRRLANLRDMASDSIAKSLTLILGNVGGTLGSAMTSRKGEVSELGKTLAGNMTSAYEPLLERHIGKPVVVECQNAPGASTATSEFSGYLVDYTDKFIAVFDAQQSAQDSFCIEVKTCTLEGLEVATEDGRARFTGSGPGITVLRQLRSSSESTAASNSHPEQQTIDLDIALLPGCSFDLALPSDHCEIDVEQTFGCDFVCPRSRAAVRYGSSTRTGTRSRTSSWRGASPS